MDSQVPEHKCCPQCTYKADCQCGCPCCEEHKKQCACNKEHCKEGCPDQHKPCCCDKKCACDHQK